MTYYILGVKTLATNRWVVEMSSKDRSKIDAALSEYLRTYGKHRTVVIENASLVYGMAQLKKLND